MIYAHIVIFLKLQTIIFYCPIYSNERLQLFRDTRNLHPLNCNILLFGNSSFTFSKHIIIVNAVHNHINNSKRFTTQIFMFCFVLNIHSTISFLIPFFSLIPLFFISKKAKTRMYFMFAKYTKSRVYTCHVYNCICDRAVNKFQNLWLDPFTISFTCYFVKLYGFIYVKNNKNNWEIKYV